MGWWDDFANNLATDLGPLISLFGEAPTKQYLSETTLPEDIVIFAMAPIGILTALVSAIRVSGSPSLRAFIGRAQEGEGNAEVELCSSTSRNVGELYNNGGIARVFGNPHLLELVFDPETSKEGFYHDEQEKGNAGIHLPKDYFNQLKNESEWTEQSTTRRKDIEGGAGAKPEEKRFALKPNLSLNVGIHERPRPWFIAAAVLGIVLQSGVLVWAGISRYVLQFFQSKATAAYAVPMTVSGTLLVSFGVGLCAVLIDRSTGERRFTRNLSSINPQSEIYWVQPGNQTIGDQGFDSFAYSEDKSRVEYVTSWKKSKRDEKGKKVTNRLVWVAVYSTTIGFVAQFLGLRACHSSVSVAQLGVMLVMSMVRAGLRTRRLNENENLMDKSPRSVTGHEIDWLALRLGKQGKTQRIWRIAHIGNDHSQKASDFADKNRRSLCIGEDYQLVGFRQPNLETEEFGLTYSPEAWLKELQSKREVLPSHEAIKAFLYRCRLARITQSWKPNLVAVRKTAEALAQVIEQTTDYISANEEISKGWDAVHTMYWPIKCEFLGKHEPSKGATEIFISLNRHVDLDGNATSKWKIDTSELEAVLGLQVWALAERGKRPDHEEDAAETPGPKEVQCTRILWNLPESADFQIESMKFNMWRAGRQPKIQKDEVKPRWSEEDSSAWAETSRAPLIFGWQNISRADQNSAKVRVLVQPTNLSLQKLCAQDMFSLFFAAILRIIQGLDMQNVSVRGPNITHPFIKEIQDAFKDSGLGSAEDALVCVVPALTLQRQAPTLLQTCFLYQSGWTVLEDLLPKRSRTAQPLQAESKNAPTEDWTQLEALVELLLRGNVSVEGTSMMNNDATLHTIALYRPQPGLDLGRLAKMVLDLAKDINVQATDRFGYTVLWSAIYWGNAEVAEVLLECKPDSLREVYNDVDHSYSPGDTPLHIAFSVPPHTQALDGRPGVIRSLLKSIGSDHRSFLQQQNKAGHTPLDVAANRSQIRKILSDLYNDIRLEFDGTQIQETLQYIMKDLEKRDPKPIRDSVVKNDTNRMQRAGPLVKSGQSIARDDNPNAEPRDKGSFTPPSDVEEQNTKEAEDQPHSGDKPQGFNPLPFTRSLVRRRGSKKSKFE